MMTLVFFWVLQTHILSSTTAWFRPPVMRFVPDQQRWLQMETGVPVKAARRSKVELIRLALATATDIQTTTSGSACGLLLARPAPRQ